MKIMLNQGVIVCWTSVGVALAHMLLSAGPQGVNARVKKGGELSTPSPHTPLIKQSKIRPFMNFYEDIVESGCYCVLDQRGGCAGTHASVCGSPGGKCKKQKGVSYLPLQHTNYWYNRQK